MLHTVAIRLPRPRMHMLAGHAARGNGRHGLRLMTHHALSGMAGDQVELYYLKMLVPPVQMQYRLIWQGRVMVNMLNHTLRVARLLSRHMTTPMHGIWALSRAIRDTVKSWLPGTRTTRISRDASPAIIRYIAQSMPWRHDDTARLAKAAARDSHLRLAISGNGAVNLPSLMRYGTDGMRVISRFSSYRQTIYKPLMQVLSHIASLSFQRILSSGKVAHIAGRAARQMLARHDFVRLLSRNIAGNSTLVAATPWRLDGPALSQDMSKSGPEAYAVLKSMHFTVAETVRSLRHREMHSLRRVVRGVWARHESSLSRRMFSSHHLRSIRSSFAISRWSRRQGETVHAEAALSSPQNRFALPSRRSVERVPLGELARSVVMTALQNYAASRAVALGYRKTPVPSSQLVDKQVQRIEQRITRKMALEIAQATPSRETMERALLTPRTVQELAEKVIGMMAQRTGLERYRRGL